MDWGYEISDDNNKRIKLIKKILTKSRIGVPVKKFNQKKSFSVKQFNEISKSIVFDDGFIDEDKSILSPEELAVVDAGKNDFSIHRSEMSMHGEEINYLIHESVVHNLKYKIIDVGLENYYLNRQAEYKKLRDARESGCMLPIIISLSSLALFFVFLYVKF